MNKFYFICIIKYIHVSDKKKCSSNEDCPSRQICNKDKVCVRRGQAKDVKINEVSLTKFKQEKQT